MDPNKGLETPNFVINIDDDSIIDYDDLALRLNYENLHANEDNIYCPSVLRNQKLWRHKAAPMMGKWAYLSDNFTSKISLKQGSHR